MRFSGQFQFFKKHKINNFPPLRSFYLQKLLPLLFSVCLFLFCLLVLVCFKFLWAQNLFRKKINRLQIVLITSFTTLLVLGTEISSHEEFHCKTMQISVENELYEAK